MFGCLRPFFSAPTIAADLEAYPKSDGSFTGVVWKRMHGSWSPRLGELSLQNELTLYKTASDLKKYELKEMTKLYLGAGQRSLHAKMTLKTGEKLYLKIKGPDRTEWGRRITECKFPSAQADDTIVDVEVEEEEASQKKPFLVPLTPMPSPKPMPKMMTWSELCQTEQSELTSDLTEEVSVSMDSERQNDAGQLEEEPRLEQLRRKTPFEEEGSEADWITQMARCFDPKHIPRRGTIRRRF